MIKNIINIEKVKLYNRIEFINTNNIKKNLKIYIFNDGCYKYTYCYYKSKKIKRNDIIIKTNKNIFISNFYNLTFNLNNIIIKMKNIIKIKNKIIKNLCNCRFSFNLY